jgi:hypothetical protein
LDTTALVAIVGIVGTLAGAIFAPFMSEIARRKSARKERLLDQRLEAYVDVLRVGARFVHNAMTLASLHNATIKGPDDDSMNLLVGQVTLVASKDVAKHFKTFTQQVGRFHVAVLDARLHHTALAARNPEDDSAQEGARSVDRVALGRKADAIRDTYHELEAAIRKDVRA